MIEHAITTLLLVVAVIHVLPLVGFAGARQLRALYGLAIDSPDLEILMRHRAMIFGILGGSVSLATIVGVQSGPHLSVGSSLLSVRRSRSSAAISSAFVA